MRPVNIDRRRLAVPPPEPERPAGGRARRLGPPQPRSARRATASSRVVVGGRRRLRRLPGRSATCSSPAAGRSSATTCRLFMVGRYPSDELWRISVAIAVDRPASAASSPASSAGAASSPARRRRRIPPVPWWRLVLGAARAAVAAARRRRPAPVDGDDAPGRGSPSSATIVAAVVGRLRRPAPARPVRPGRSCCWRSSASSAVILFLRVPLDVTDWGGLMLNLFLAVAGITLCFPLGVLLALGRRSRSCRSSAAMCVGYIELFRGVPLFVLLLLAVHRPRRSSCPARRANPSLVLRAIVAMTLFTAAYVAEIVRGGLQSLPTGQTEAAQALGLSPGADDGPDRAAAGAAQRDPGARRAVHQPVQGHDAGRPRRWRSSTCSTCPRRSPRRPAFQGQGLTAEVLAFVMLLFWVGCITMSRESQRLERKLGVGTR